MVDEVGQGRMDRWKSLGQKLRFNLCTDFLFSSFPEPYGSRVIISRHYYISTYQARKVKMYLSLPYSAVSFALAISQDGHATESMSGLRLKVTVKCAEVELL